MNSPLSYALLSTIIISLLSFAGILTLSLKRDWLEKIIFILISLSAGALLGDVFLHLLPELIEVQGGLLISSSLLILTGIVIFFMLEKFIIWHHHHSIETPEDHAKEQHSHSRFIGVMNLVGDGLHNLIDGLIIGTSFLISPEVGIATSIAVILHEIPREIGDFGVLIHSGFSVKKALFFNFLTAIFAILGAVAAIFIGSESSLFLQYIIPLTAGGFIYIAGSDIIPELKKTTSTHENIIQLFSLLLGILIMYGLLLIS